jgi:hypothetical protein
MAAENQNSGARKIWTLHGNDSKDIYVATDMNAIIHTIVRGGVVHAVRATIIQELRHIWTFQAMG